MKISTMRRRSQLCCLQLHVWIHSSFRCIISKQKGILDQVQRREGRHNIVDKVGVEHRLAVWDRLLTVSSRRSLLASLEVTVMWGCEAIAIPFDDFRKVPLVIWKTSLGEGDDPTDGNDFLFLIINHLVETGSVRVSSTSCPPRGTRRTKYKGRFIVSWCGGIGFLGTVMGLNFERDVYSNDLGVGLFKKPTRGPRRGLTKDNGGPHIMLQPVASTPHRSSPTPSWNPPSLETTATKHWSDLRNRQQRCTMPC